MDHTHTALLSAKESKTVSVSSREFSFYYLVKSSGVENYYFLMPDIEKITLLRSEIIHSL